MTVVEIIMADLHFLYNGECLVGLRDVMWLMSAQHRMCAIGGALSETVATVSLRTEKMLSMFRLRKKTSVTGPNRRWSRLEEYQKWFRYDFYKTTNTCAKFSELSSVSFILLISLMVCFLIGISRKSDVSVMQSGCHILIVILWIQLSVRLVW